MDTQKMTESENQKFRQALANDPEIVALNQEDALTMCQHCTYWEIRGAGYIGMCTKNAPLANSEGQAIFPAMKDTDRCGEFKPSTTLRLEAAMARVEAEVRGRNFSGGQ